MSLETDLHQMRPALDRAMAVATGRAPSTPSTSRWSRPRTVVLAFAVAACVAGAVGVVARISSSDRHGPLPPSTLAPADSSSTTSPSSTDPVAPTTMKAIRVPLQSVDWASVTYPITPRCGTTFTPPVTVGHVDYAAPAPGVALAIVEVACTHGAGTPPVALYVYDYAPSTEAPHLADTLVRASDGWQANDFNVDGATIVLPVYGFSSDTVANCCPDVHTSLDWSWTGSRYELVGSVPAHVPGPAIYGGD